MTRTHDKDEAFLSRWSRLKRTEPARQAPAPASAPAVEPPAEETDEELLARLDLPDPETLREGDDVSGFMSEAVPARLRRVALRRLWRLNPALGHLDGLVDYGEDYTDAATVIENMQTVYEVGKGAAQRFLKTVEDAAEAPAPETAPESGTAPEEPEEMTPAPAAPEPVVQEVATLEADPGPPPPAAPEARRRMTFSFDA